MNLSANESQGQFEFAQTDVLSEDRTGTSMVEVDNLIETVKKTLTDLAVRFTRDQVAHWLNTPDEFGASLIHYITALNMTDLIEVLCMHGADINVKAKDTNLTPLVIAAAHGFDQSCRILMAKGAQVVEK